MVIIKMVLSDLLNLQNNFSEKFDDFWNYTTLQQDFLNEYSLYLVAKENDEIIGIIGVKQILDEYTIMNIVTRVDKRNLKVGSKMLENIISLAYINKIKQINLEVNVQNEIAIKLYEKYNFVKVGIRKKYYNNKYDALLMTLYL